jgi:hypothetical protein
MKCQLITRKNLTNIQDDDDNSNTEHCNCKGTHVSIGTKVCVREYGENDPWECSIHIAHFSSLLRRVGEISHYRLSVTALKCMVLFSSNQDFRS